MLEKIQTIAVLFITLTTFDPIKQNICNRNIHGRQTEVAASKYLVKFSRYALS